MCVPPFGRLQQEVVIKHHIFAYRKHSATAACVPHRRMTAMRILHLYVPRNCIFGKKKVLVVFLNGLKWYFAEKVAADLVRARFAKEGLSEIVVAYMPPTPRKRRRK